jgi:glutathione S-transferase
MPYGDPRFYPADPLVSADFAGWWQRGFAVVRRGWRQLALVQLIAAVPALALLVPSQLAVDLATRDTAGAAAEGRLELGGFLAASGLSILTLLAAGLIYSIGTLASVRVVVTVATGGEARVGRALRSVLPRVPALTGGPCSRL